MPVMSARSATEPRAWIVAAVRTASRPPAGSTKIVSRSTFAAPITKPIEIAIDTTT
ncbi:hypothetical protein D3C74_436330 [compost metagenome]